MNSYFEIYDEDFTALGIVDVFNELVWERRYFEAGYFELHAPATANNSQLIKEGRILYKPNSEESGYITCVRRYTSDGRELMTAYGRFLSFRFRKKVIKGDYEYTGTAEAFMTKLVNDVLLNSDNDDYFPRLKLGTLNNCKGRFSGVVGYGDLHDTLKKIAEESGTAFRLRFSPEERFYIFECYEGADKSINQTVNPQMVFSEEYDNILSESELTTDLTPLVNAVTARYYGELGEVVVEYNPTGATGKQKNEVYVEGKAVTMKNSEGETVLNVSATRKKLLQLAKEKIKPVSFDFSASVSYEGSYKSDYELGDIVTIYHKKWGITEHKRISAITENTTEAGFSVIPVFSTILSN